MSEVKERAARAKQLLNDPVFTEVVAEIRENASMLFLNPTSSIDDSADAHQRVRMVQMFLDTLQSRISAEALEDKRKGQHRYVD